MAADSSEAPAAWHPYGQYGLLPWAPPSGILVLALCFLGSHLLARWQRGAKVHAGTGSATPSSSASCPAKTAGPPLHPLLGLLPGMLQNKDHLHDWITGILQACPGLTFSSFIPGLREVYTASPSNLQHILKDNFDNYPKGEALRDTLQDFLGHGIFNSDGDAWRQQRKTASLEFSTNSLRRLVLTSLHQELHQGLHPVLQAASDEGSVVDLQDLLLRFSFDNICQVGFGHHPGCLRPGLPTVPLAHAFDGATKVMMGRLLLPGPVWRLMRFLKLGPERDFDQGMQTIFSFAMELIQKRRQEIAEADAQEAQGAQGHGHKEEGQSPGEAQGTRHTDLLSRFIMLDGQQEGAHSDIVLRDICTNFLIAGRDTSSLALTWFFLMLSQHPDVEQRVVEEIDGIVARRGAAPADAAGEEQEEEPLSFDELREMTYTHAALNETLRLYPIVPMDFKQALADDVLPDGTRVLRGTRVNYCIYAQGRMTQVWGADAAEFRPQRWLTPEGTLRVESPFRFPAFNAGPRLCLGKDMAYTQMKCIVGSVLRKFRVEVLPSYQAQYCISLTLNMKGGLPVRVTPR